MIFKRQEYLKWKKRNYSFEKLEYGWTAFPLDQTHQ
jgi:hypothetical protein